MRVVKVLVAALTAAAAMLVLQPGTATASPVRITKWQPASASCGDINGLTVIFVPGTGPFTPLFLSTRQTLVPYQVRFNSVGGGGDLKSRHQYTVGEVLTKPAPMPAGAVTCEVVGGFVEQGQLYDFTATMTGVLH